MMGDRPLDWIGRPIMTDVYCVQGVDGGPIKIGCSRHVVKRAKDIGKELKTEMRVLVSAPGTVRTERTLHFRFQSLSVHGEWFEPGEDLLAYIDEVATTGKHTGDFSREYAGYRDELLPEILDYITLHRMTRSEFGLRFMNSAIFIHELSCGSRPRPPTRARLREVLRADRIAA